ncbi:hypothetical protein J6TS1_32550 [Siminovitchia terrae]|uniref:Uncharacterized protein n=1 Tax=Siminovitchia terrae TaxID=1914933 RepID=A0ABQ4KZJ0_SIMTE|nr:hypothetical protein [Siminovitchia terrae]GIN97385.1 hypothetical protein J6TS1_32550 [Siminovitchia terrae]
MKAYWYSIQCGFKPRLNKVKPPADASDFQRKFIEQSSIKSGCKYAKAHLIFIQQKPPTSISGEMKAYWYSIQWGSNPGE